MTRPPIVAEPGRDYITLPPVVVDCSVLAAVLFDEPSSQESRDVLTGHSLFAPWLIGDEMISVALKKARAGFTDIARQGIEYFARLRLNRRAPDPVAQWQLAESCSLTAYDAAYLQLAVELNAPLVTYDEALGAAARKVLGGR